MIRFTLLFLICQLMFSTASFGQTSDSLKRIAVKFALERNECREILFICEETNSSYQVLDSIQTTEISRLRSAINGLGGALSQCEEENAANQKEIAKLKRNRKWFMLTGFVGGVVGCLILL